MTSLCVNAAWRGAIRGLAVLLCALFLGGCSTPRVGGPLIAYPVSAEHPDASAIAMAVDYWDPPGWWTQHSARGRAARVAQTAEVKELESYWATRGLWAYRSEGTLDHLHERMAHGQPVLVPLQVTTGGQAELRLALVTQIPRSTNSYRIYGLEDRPVVWLKESFESAWRYAGRGMITLAPPNKVSWALTRDERIGRGRFWMAQGEYGEALSDFEQALAAESNEGLTGIEMADALFYLGRYEEAEPLYRAALAENDLLARAMNNLAFLLWLGNGNLDEALRLSRNATILEPDNPRMLDTLGAILHKQGQSQEAMRTLERAYVRSMKSPPETQSRIARRLIQIYHEQGTTHLAGQTLADALKTDPSFYVPPEWFPYLRAQHPVYR